MRWKKTPNLFTGLLAFLQLHRLPALIVGVVVAASIFSILVMARTSSREPTSTPARAYAASRVTREEILPPKPLDPWGEDPFKDVLYYMEIEAKEREKETRRAAEEDALKKAKEQESELTTEEQIKKTQEEAARKAAEERERLLEEARERERRRRTILSIKINGIILGPAKESRVIIEGRAYRIGDKIRKDGVEIKLEIIEPDGVQFRDPVDGKIYKVHFSR